MSLPRPINFYLDLKKHLDRFYLFDEQKLRLVQDRRFRSILEFVCTNVPFYNNKFSENKIDSRKIQGLQQLKEFPFTDCIELFSHPQGAHTDTKNTLFTFRSSGTTGHPKDIHLSAFDWLYLRRLAYLRMFFSSGCHPYYKTLFLRSPQLSFAIQSKWFWNLGLMREKAICITIPLHKQVLYFNQYRPDVFYCCTADAIALGDFIKRQMKHIHKAKCIFTTGEMLTEKDRQTMIENLGERVIDFYANTEVGIIAWQCSKTDAYHINADQLYVEIVDGEKSCQDREAGEVVLTTLVPCCSPLIRYRTGDMAVLERGRCKCGSWFPRLSRIMGRKNDFLVDSKGEKISPYVLMVTMDRFKKVNKYRICQDEFTKYTIYLELNDSDNNKTITKEKIRGAYRKIFGAESNIFIADLSDLPSLDIRTKRKVIVSYIN